MNAYLVSHNGLGDNLIMIGALRFLLQFYDKIYFLCKDIYYPNVHLFFLDNPRIICIPFDTQADIQNEFYEIQKIIQEKYQDPNIDIFICGIHKEYLKSKITNESFLRYKAIDKKYTVDFDTLTHENYMFIETFYKDIHLNLTQFYDFFYLPITEESMELYHTIQSYYIVFIQCSCSSGETINISHLIDKYLDEENVILVCNDKNLYDSIKQKEKYDLCQPFVYNKLVNYMETLKNCDEIYIIDSCFTGIVLPYLKTKKLKTDKVRIIRRQLCGEIVV